MSTDQASDSPNPLSTSPLNDAPQDPAPQDGPVIDLRVAAYEALVDAALASNWIPQEHYTANDWIADCCTFLRDGPASFRDEAAPPAPQVLSNEQLLAELSRRGLLRELHGAVGALHDHLERAGHLDSEAPTTSYLLYRLRRQDALVSGTHDAEQVAAAWDQKIAELDEDVEDVATHVTEMTRQYGFTIDEDSVREAVAESANLLGITLDESAARRACERAMELKRSRSRETQSG